jgi:hypothetical protein
MAKKEENVVGENAFKVQCQSTKTQELKLIFKLWKI